MKLSIDYIKSNSFLLFKSHPKNSKKALFNSKGFWFSDEAQREYNKINNQPHLYVAWTLQDEGYYYIGKSFQKGGRWKRYHAYHLGTLAYHLLDNIRYDDQDHSNWIRQWMNVDTVKSIDDSNYFVSLKKPVYICFIPFSIYSGLSYKALSNAEIKRINTTAEEKLIKYLAGMGISLLNVQNNKKEKMKSGTPLEKKSMYKSALSHHVSNNSVKCVSFNVTQAQLIHEVANDIPNLPTGKCVVTIRDEYNETNYLYVKKNGDFIRKIVTPRRTVSSYFFAPDTNAENGKLSKSKIVQMEMEKRKIKNAIVTVCPIQKSKSELAESKRKPKPRPVKGNQSIKGEISGISNSFKIVFICSSKKRDNSELRIGKKIVQFRAISDPANNIFRPDDEIHEVYRADLNNIPAFKGKIFKTWRDIIILNAKEKNILQLCPAYDLYSNKIYRKLHEKYSERFYILSAGWGLVHSDFPLPKYDITFSKGYKIPPEIIRNRMEGYNDFNNLSDDNKSQEEIIFIGTPPYLPLFYHLTQALKNRKIVFWKQANTPQQYPAPNNTFIFIQYDTKSRSNWWYELVRSRFLV